MSLLITFLFLFCFFNFFELFNFIFFLSYFQLYFFQFLYIFMVLFLIFFRYSYFSTFHFFGTSLLIRICTRGDLTKFRKLLKKNTKVQKKIKSDVTDHLKMFFLFTILFQKSLKNNLDSSEKLLRNIYPFLSIFWWDFLISKNFRPKSSFFQNFEMHRSLFKVDIFSVQDSSQGLILSHQKNQISSNILIFSVFFINYNRWHQSINWHAIEILSKIKPEKVVKLNSLETFFKKWFFSAAILYRKYIHLKNGDIWEKWIFGNLPGPINFFR